MDNRMTLTPRQLQRIGHLARTQTALDGQLDALRDARYSLMQRKQRHEAHLVSLREQQASLKRTDEALREALRAAYLEAEKHAEFNRSELALTEEELENGVRVVEDIRNTLNAVKEHSGWDRAALDIEHRITEHSGPLPILPGHISGPDRLVSASHYSSDGDGINESAVQLTLPKVSD